MKNYLHTFLSWKTIEGLWLFLVKFFPVYIYTIVFNKHIDCWLFTERRSDARDNGYVLYKWIHDNHPEQRIVYAIDFNTQDYAKVNGLGEVIRFGSYKHWYYYYASSACCGTTWSCCHPNPFVFLLTRHLMPTKSKRVFLQHGITKDYIPELTYKKLVADIVVCGAFPEWQYIAANFGYPDNHVRYLGFARFDRLINTSSTKSRILYMPTWRKWLANEKEFEKTEYYQRIASLLSSNRLLAFLEKNCIEFVYFTHPSIRGFKDYFSKFSNDHVRVLNNNDMDLQKLICSSNMLVTDYSSIYFDFAFQNKPVLYYHFDYGRYRNSHFQEGYFSYQNDGFGPIFTEENDLISGILSAFECNWQLSEEYALRGDSFFPMKDRYNCLRHFEVLKEITSFQ